MPQSPGLCPGILEAHVPKLDFIVDIVPLFHGKGAFVHFVREVEKFINLDQVLIVEPQLADFVCETADRRDKPCDGRLIQQETAEAEHADIDLRGNKEENHEIDSRVQKDRQHPVVSANTIILSCPLRTYMSPFVFIHHNVIQSEYDRIDAWTFYERSDPSICFCKPIYCFRLLLNACR